MHNYQQCFSTQFPLPKNSTIDFETNIGHVKNIYIFITVLTTTRKVQTTQLVESIFLALTSLNVTLLL